MKEVCKNQGMKKWLLAITNSYYSSFSVLRIIFSSVLLLFSYIGCIRVYCVTMEKTMMGKRGKV